MASVRRSVCSLGRQPPRAEPGPQRPAQSIPTQAALPRGPNDPCLFHAAPKPQKGGSSPAYAPPGHKVQGEGLAPSHPQDRVSPLRTGVGPGTGRAPSAADMVPWAEFDLRKSESDSVGSRLPKCSSLPLLEGEPGAGWLAARVSAPE